jgi:2-polyprenyl-3-methyl-5-hydroxy-6-metoxy-1,4-benzoquinol methylase
MGTTIRFLMDDHQTRRFGRLSEIIRSGLSPDESDIVADNPQWVNFARNMAPLMQKAAEDIAQYLRADESGPWKVLDIAAGHGIFGVTLARHNPHAKIVAVDWPAVLEVARENAIEAGVEDRYSTIPGSAFEVDFGTGYDVILLTNFLHHFDIDTNVNLLRKVFGALKPGGRTVALDFVPDESRVSPPVPAKFAMIMLAATPAGDAYPFTSFDRMFREAGFESVENVRLSGPENLIVARR